MGNSIAKMRQAGNDHLVIEINGGAETAEVVKAEVEWSLGPGPPLGRRRILH